MSGETLTELRIFQGSKDMGLERWPGCLRNEG
jgi:hypothetical protein